MKYTKLFTVCLILLMILFSVSNCKKETIHEIVRDTLIIKAIDSLGITQSNLKSDSIYKADTDGFLYVEFFWTKNGYELGAPTAKIYSDNSSNPTTLISLVYFNSTAPIKKGNYWVVKNLTSNILNIKWTPLY